MNDIESLVEMCMLLPVDAENLFLKVWNIRRSGQMRR